MIDPTDLKNAADAAAAGINALLAAKAAPSAITLEASLALVADARVACDAFTDGALALQNAIATAGGPNLT
jgi:hypothetical protein